MSVRAAETLRFDGHQVDITHPEKVLFPEDRITKGDLIRYYQRVSPWMLAHLEGRPLSLQRFPDGIDKPGFFQKAAGAYYPGWINKVTVQKAGGTVKHVVCDDVATLVYLANQACITPHIWLSRVDKLHFPDQLIFDFDPSTEDFATVVAGALSLKSILDDLELPAFIKATGSRGLHVAVPLNREQDFDAVRAFARRVAGGIVAKDPSRYTTEQHKSRRRGRVFIDVNRNAYAQTAVAAYAVRPRNGAPIAIPLAWSELQNKGLRPDGITIRNVFDRLDKGDDTWKAFWRHAASLDKASRKLEKLLA